MANYIVGDGPVNGTLSASFALTDNGEEKTGSLVYTVIADTLATTEEDIRLNTPNFPLLGEIRSGMYTTAITLTQKAITTHAVSGADTWAWTAEVEFSSQLDLNVVSSPLARPPVYNWGGTLEGVPLEFDTQTGALVQTAALEPIDIQRQAIMPTVQVEKFFNYPFDANLILNNCGYSNSVAYLGAPVGTCLVGAIRSQKVIVQNVEYAKAVIPIKFELDPNGPLVTQDTVVFAKVPHVGTQYIDRSDPGNPVIRKLDDNRNPGLFRLENDGTRKGDDNTDPPNQLDIGRVPKTNFAAALGI